MEKLCLCQKMSVGKGGFQQEGQAEVLRVRQADVHAAIAASVKVQLSEPIFLLAAPVGVVVRETRLVIVIRFYPQRLDGHAEGLYAVVVDEFAAQHLQDMYLLIAGGTFQIIDQGSQVGGTAHTLIPFRNVLNSIPLGWRSYKLRSIDDLICRAAEPVRCRVWGRKR